MHNQSVSVCNSRTDFSWNNCLIRFVYTYIDSYRKILRSSMRQEEYRVHTANFSCCCIQPRTELTLSTTIINMITCTSSCAVCNTSFSVSISVLEMTLYVKKKKAGPTQNAKYWGCRWKLKTSRLISIYKWK